MEQLTFSQFDLFWPTSFVQTFSILHCDCMPKFLNIGQSANHSSSFYLINASRASAQLARRKLADVIHFSCNLYDVVWQTSLRAGNS